MRPAGSTRLAIPAQLDSDTLRPMVTPIGRNSPRTVMPPSWPILCAGIIAGGQQRCQYRRVGLGAEIPQRGGTVRGGIGLGVDAFLHRNGKPMERAEPATGGASLVGSTGCLQHAVRREHPEGVERLHPRSARQQGLRIGFGLDIAALHRGDRRCGAECRKRFTRLGLPCCAPGSGTRSGHSKRGCRLH